MQVRLRELDDGTILVTRLDVMGGTLGEDGNTVAVSTGQTYHGYRHRRLRAMGDGVHELRRHKPETQPGSVPDMSE